MRFLAIPARWGLLESICYKWINRPSLERIAYQTPYAFSKKGMKKKRKKNIEKQTGYKFVDEALEKKDIEQIRKQIRQEVADILFDIWIKRSSWKGK